MVDLNLYSVIDTGAVLNFPLYQQNGLQNFQHEEHRLPHEDDRTGMIFVMLFGPGMEFQTCISRPLRPFFVIKFLNL